jgi:hypothetical protein
MLFCSYATMTSFYVAVVIFSGFVATIVERRPIEFTFVEFEYVVVFCLMMAVTVVLTGFTVCICIDEDTYIPSQLSLCIYIYMFCLMMAVTVVLTGFTVYIC